MMSNHYHLVLRINASQARGWSDQEVLERWCTLFSGPLLVQRYRAGERLTDTEKLKVADRVALYRSRLADLSWFMRCLNEPIARMANAEDDCTGRFWEGRFKSQALLDEQALISCMAYVDLNPMRAGIADTIEQSCYTSIQQRITGALPGMPPPKGTPELMAFSHQHNEQAGLPCSWADYRDLIQWGARSVLPRKRRPAAVVQPGVLRRLGIVPGELIRYLNRREQGFVYVIGTRQAIRDAAGELGRKFLKGISAAQRLFLNTR